VTRLERARTEKGIEALQATADNENVADSWSIRRADTTSCAPGQETGHRLHRARDLRRAVGSGRRGSRLAAAGRRPAAGEPDSSGTTALELRGPSLAEVRRRKGFCISRPENFSCAGECAPLSKYRPYKFTFLRPSGSAFHVSRRTFGDNGEFGNYPIAVLIRGRAVACDARETRFLIAYRSTASFTLACLPGPPG
jgi:hypothetical protein